MSADQQASEQAAQQAQAQAHKGGATQVGAAASGAHDSGPETAPLVKWLRSHDAPVWLWPPVVVLVTAWLGSHDGHEVRVAYWLALVAGCVAYVLAHAALKPMDRARAMAACAGVVVGLATAGLLLHSTHHSLLGR